MRNYQGGYKEVAAMLIERGADVDKADYDNEGSWTPLYYAARVSVDNCASMRVCFLTLIAAFALFKYRMVTRI